jgi:hypothetical protein
MRGCGGEQRCFDALGVWFEKKWTDISALQQSSNWQSKMEEASNKQLQLSGPALFRPRNPAANNGRERVACTRAAYDTPRKKFAGAKRAIA